MFASITNKSNYGILAAPRQGIYAVSTFWAETMERSIVALMAPRPTEKQDAPRQEIYDLPTFWTETIERSTVKLLHWMAHELGNAHHFEFASSNSSESNLSTSSLHSDLSASTERFESYFSEILLIPRTRYFHNRNYCEILVVVKTSERPLLPRED